MVVVVVLGLKHMFFIAQHIAELVYLPESLSWNSVPDFKLKQEEKPPKDEDDGESRNYNIGYVGGSDRRESRIRRAAASSSQLEWILWRKPGSDATESSENHLNKMHRIFRECFSFSKFSSSENDSQATKMTRFAIDDQGCAIWKWVFRLPTKKKGRTAPRGILYFRVSIRISLPLKWWYSCCCIWWSRFERIERGCGGRQAFCLPETERDDMTVVVVCRELCYTQDEKKTRT